MGEDVDDRRRVALAREVEADRQRPCARGASPFYTLSDRFLNDWSDYQPDLMVNLLKFK